MKTVYTPEDIVKILEATIGPVTASGELDDDELRERRLVRSNFIGMVGEQAAAEVLASHGKRSGAVLVFAGDDMCGAYALATATSLHALGCRAKVCLFNIAGNMLSDDCRNERDRFVRCAGHEWLNEVVNPGATFTMPELDSTMTVVDGLFGIDYQKPLRGGYQAIARYINESPSAPNVVSLDIPSGMNLDLQVGMVNRNIIHASLTLAIVGPTLAFFMPENAPLIGRWKTLRLPLNKSAVKHPHYRIADAKAVRAILPVRSPYTGKHDLGTALICAGSYGMLGAAVLATRAATRSGCGKVICHAPRCGFYVLQSSVPSALFETDGADFDIQRFESEHTADATAVGPGIGTSDSTVYGLERFIKNCRSNDRPLIIDADALNCIAKRPSILDFLPPASVLTPHAGEFDRLFGPSNNHSVRLLKAIAMAERYKIIIVLKGHYTFTVWPDGSVVVNASGTDALATAGSGDVLTGLLCGLEAQNMAPELAAVAAVYIHGIAGRLAASRHGARGTTAEDIAELTGAAIENICNPPSK